MLTLLPARPLRLRGFCLGCGPATRCVRPTLRTALFELTPPSSDELGYSDQLQKENINLRTSPPLPSSPTHSCTTPPPPVEGANFHPDFLKLNPNATLPTLATSDGVYTSTAAVVRYVIKHAPKPAGRPSGTDLVDALHVAAIDPNFSMLSAVRIPTLPVPPHPLPSSSAAPPK